MDSVCFEVWSVMSDNEFEIKENTGINQGKQ